jgi:hypothetical protein
MESAPETTEEAVTDLDPVPACDPRRWRVL